MALAIEKTPRIAKSSLLQNHHVQFQIGEAEARLRSARSYVDTTAGEVWDEVVSSGELTIAQRMDIRMATTFAIHEAKAVADTAWEVAGASAIFPRAPCSAGSATSAPSCSSCRAANPTCRRWAPTSWGWSRI